MLVTSSRLIGAPVLSLQTGAPVGVTSEPIINPDTLKIIAFKLTHHVRIITFLMLIPSVNTLT